MAAPATPTALVVLNQGWDPNSLVTYGFGSGRVKVGWSGDSGARFQVRVYHFPLGLMTIVATALTAVGEKTAKLFDLPELNHTYTCAVSAINDDGTSSEIGITFMTPAVLVDEFDPPTDIEVPTGTITGSTALVTWTDETDTEFCFFLELSMGPLTSPIKIQVAPLESQLLLTGLVPGMTYSIRMRTSGTGIDPDTGWTDPIEFLTDGATDSITGPALIPLRLGGAVGASYLFSGPGDVQTWGLAGGPSGAVISVPVWAEGNANIGAISGTVGEAGVFDAEVSAAVVSDGALSLYSFLVRILVSGGGFLTWLHDDPEVRDLQFSPRTGLLSSYSSNPLRLKETEDFSFRVVFIDGSRVLNDFAPSEIRLIIRMADDLDGAPLLDIRRPAPASVNLSGNFAWLLPIEVESPEIERRFRQLNAAPAGLTASATLPAQAELSVKHAGVWLLSKTILATIEQDLRG